MPPSPPLHSIGDLSSILDQSADAIVKIDRAWRIVYLNRPACQLLAASGEVIGTNHWESFPSSRYEGSPWVFHYYRAMDHSIRGEFEHYYSEPLNMWLRVTACPLPDGIVVFFRDTTAAHHAADMLREQTQHLQLALNASNGVGTWTWDFRTGIVLADQDFSTFYGVQHPDTARGTPVEEFIRNVHPDDLVSVETAMRNAQHYGADLRREHRVLLSDGTIRWVDVRGRCQFSPDGTPLACNGVTIDITERRLAEEARLELDQALRASQARIAAIYASLHEYAGILDPAGKVVDCNDASLSFANNSLDDVVGRPFWECPWFIHTPGMPARIRGAVERAAAGAIIREELFLTRPSGEVLCFDFSIAPIRNDAGEVVFLVPEGRDITELKRSDQALRNSEERLRIAAETAQLGTWEMDVATGELSCSAICQQNFGRPDTSFRHYSELEAIVHPDDRALFQQAVSRGGVRTEYRVIWPDGSIHWILSSGTVQYSATGAAARIIRVTMNVTDRHVIAEAMMQTEKLAAVGRLASSIAHEINNPLEAVTNLLYLAQHTSDTRSLREYLTLAERELTRVSLISNQTLKFHKQATKPRPVTCEDLFDSVMPLHHPRLTNRHITLEKRRRTDRPVLCFDGEIRQVLNNLVSNAIDAMSGTGGRLLLRSREATDWRSGRRGMVLTVADTGGGIPPAAQARIFDAFFTTKGIAGTGLGLWVSKEIVDRHAGRLRFRTSQRPGAGGTVFSLFLPYEAAVR
jgi:PAS domain S-box-containing protein